MGQENNAEWINDNNKNNSNIRKELDSGEKQ